MPQVANISCLILVKSAHRTRKQIAELFNLLIYFHFAYPLLLLLLLLMLLFLLLILLFGIKKKKHLRNTV